MQAAERRKWEDKQDILENEEGFVIYDGGTYSRGPIRITPMPGDVSPSTSAPGLEVSHLHCPRCLFVKHRQQMPICPDAVTCNRKCCSYEYQYHDFYAYIMHGKMSKAFQQSELVCSMQAISS